MHVDSSSSKQQATAATTAESNFSDPIALNHYATKPPAAVTAAKMTETMNLMTTYGILIALLMSLWVLYALF